MKLIIGGRAQGKLDYILQKYGLENCLVSEAILPDEQHKTVIVNRFHDWVKERILAEGCPEEEIMTFVEKCPECIIISDEVGNGIVPMDIFEREYRERTGRILVELAGRAEEVVRVICGIGQRIK